MGVPIIQDYSREEKIALARANQGALIERVQTGAPEPEYVPPVTLHPPLYDAVRKTAVEAARATWAKVQESWKPIPRATHRPPAPRNPWSRRSWSKHRVRIIFEADRRCYWCGLQGDDLLGPDGRKWHLDHLIPLALGGPDKRSNLVLACASCNLSRGGRGGKPAMREPKEVNT